MKRHLVRLVIIFAVGLGAATIDGAIRGFKRPPEVPKNTLPPIPPKPANATPTAPPLGTPSPTETPAETNSAEHLTLEYLRQLIDSGSIILIDARSRDEHVAGRIPASLHLEPADVDASNKVVQFLTGIQSDDPSINFVIYCGGGDCHASETLGSQMIRYGFDAKRIFIYEGGFPEWQKAGLEVEQGPPIEP